MTTERRLPRQQPAPDNTSRRAGPGALLLLSSLAAGCAHTGTASDGLSTGTALARGATESGPIAGLHPGLVPLTIIARAYMVQRARRTPDCVPVVRVVSGVGWGATANNLLAASHFGGPVTIGAGILVGLWVQYAMKAPAEEYCRLTCSVDDLPEGATRAICRNGRIVLAGNERN